MVERGGSHPASGKPALITSAEDFDGSTMIAPSRFKVDLQGQRLVALEFSYDHAVVEIWHALRGSPQILEDIWQLIADGGLADNVGIGILPRATIPLGKGEELVEESWDQKSVLTAQALVSEKDEVIVTTGWPFITDDPITMGCIKYCMQAGGSAHCRHHAGVRPQ